MLGHLFQSHEITLFMMLACLAIIVSLGAVIVVTHLVPLEVRQKENNALGYVGIIIGLIYGVLVGLTAIHLTNTVTDTSTAVRNEANAVINLVRESEWLSNPTRTEVQKELNGYVNHVVKDEWPKMQAGEKVSDVGDLSVHRISGLLKTYTIAGDNDKIAVAALLSELKVLYNAREARIAKSEVSLNPEIWAAIFAGTVLLILITYLFAMNFYMHVVAASAVTLMTFAMIFLLVTIDKPFQGQYVVQPDVFEPVATFIKHHMQQ